MNLPQENFDRAVDSARLTLDALVDHDRGYRITLEDEATVKLRTLMWDLEAVQAAIRLELMNRDSRPMDLG